MPVLLRRPVLAVNVALALLVVGGGAWAWTSVRGGATAEAASSVRTVPVAEGAVTASVTADGSVASAATAGADFGTTGTVTEIAVSVGQAVTKGQVLAKIDPAAAQRALTLAKADRTAAGAALTRAKKAGSDATTAENQVEQADLAVDEAQAGLDGTVLRSPMDGTVVAVNGTLGGSSSAGGSGAETSAFVDLADLGRLQVTAKFAEADTTRLEKDQKATITWNALQGATAEGTVQAIDPQATTADDVVTYGVTVSIGKLPTGVKPGQTVSVRVVTGAVENAVTVTSAAVRGSGDRHTVVVANGTAQEVRQVEVGLKGDTAYEIRSGLTVGERVVLPQVSTSTGNNQGGPVLIAPGGGGLPGGGRGVRTGGGR